MINYKFHDMNCLYSENNYVNYIGKLNDYLINYRKRNN
jgi:hypothetical protein